MIHLVNFISCYAYFNLCMLSGNSIMMAFIYSFVYSDSQFCNCLFTIMSSSQVLSNNLWVSIGCSIVAETLSLRGKLIRCKKSDLRIVNSREQDKELRNM